MENLLQQFLDRVSVTKSENTHRTYGEQLSQIFPDKVVTFDVDYLVQKLRGWKEKGLSRNTINMRLGAYYELMKFAVRRGIAVPGFGELEDIVKNYKKEKKVRIAATEDQVEALINKTNELKYKAIFYIMYYCGLRVGEVVKLNMNDIKEGDFLLVSSEEGETKNKKERLVPMPPHVANMVKTYILNERVGIPLNSDKPLFVTDNGRIKRNTIQQQISRYAKALGLEGISAHTFRHGCATRLIEKGVDIISVKETLGHEAVTTTQEYCHVTPAMLEKVREAQKKE